MKRTFAALLLLLSAIGLADESYLGIYIEGSKIGYTHSVSAPAKLDGKAAIRTDTTTLISLALLGQGMSIDQRTTSWADSKGAPLRVRASMASAGRGQTINAVFNGSKIDVTIDNSGSISKKALTIPSDGKYVDDPVVALLDGKTKPGAQRTFYSFEPMTVTLERSTAKLVGKSKAIVRGLPFDATLIEVTARQIVSRIYVSAKGDFIKAEMPLGMEMLPLSKAEALRPDAKGGLRDLALISRIELDAPLPDVASLEWIKLRFTNAELKSLPSDGHQDVVQEGKAWLVTIHPAIPDTGPSATIAAASAAMPQWVKPGLNIPSKNQQFVDLAQRILGGSEGVAEAAEKVRQYVTGEMKPNATIGVLRDASEILKTKEGVCRDYAVLTATILRAAGVPSKLVSGLVHQQGAFYYHAWVEAFDGGKWYGVDATRPDGKVGVGHIKLSEGTLESAFSFTFLGQVRVEVLETKKKG